LLLLSPQVALDGSLVPLPQDQIQQLKARCGRGGLRVLALAYKDMLLQPAHGSSGGSSSAYAVGASGSMGTAADPQQQQQQQKGGNSWELLEDDDDQKDLVLIGLLALEDPGGSEQGATCTAALLAIQWCRACCEICSACQAASVPAALQLHWQGKLQLLMLFH
jgi:hypothetical protein